MPGSYECLPHELDVGEIAVRQLKGILTMIDREGLSLAAIFVSQALTELGGVDDAALGIE
jgi:hypothetical protein